VYIWCYDADDGVKTGNVVIAAERKSGGRRHVVLAVTYVGFSLPAVGITLPAKRRNQHDWIGGEVCAIRATY